MDWLSHLRYYLLTHLILKEADLKLLLISQRLLNKLLLKLNFNIIFKLIKQDLL